VPRPSSPVHAKASTKRPYLTLESPHHQRQLWARSAENRETGTKLGRAEQRGSVGVVVNLSLDCSAQIFRQRLPKIHASRHRFEKPIHNVKDASDRRNGRTTAAMTQRI
jgi:hypothetical protein